MALDPFSILCMVFVVFVYGAIVLISLIFTFSIELFERIDGLLNLEFLARRIFNPLERNINTINDWLIDHNRIMGPLFVFFALLDIYLFLSIIRIM